MIVFIAIKSYQHNITLNSIITINSGNLISLTSSALKDIKIIKIGSEKFIKKSIMFKYISILLKNVYLERKRIMEPIDSKRRKKINQLDFN